MNEIIDYKICAECGGFCCNRMFRVIEKHEKTPEVEEYFAAVAIESKQIGDRTCYVIRSGCKHNTETGCELEDNKPQMCKEFPSGEHEIWIEFCPLMKKLKEDK